MRSLSLMLIPLWDDHHPCYITKMGGKEKKGSIEHNITGPQSIEINQRVTQNWLKLRASPLMLSMWPCTWKSDEEKLKHAGLDEEF